MKRMLISLTLTCLLCSTVLGVVYVATKGLIAEAQRENLEKSLGEVVPEGFTVSTEARILTMDGTNYECYCASGADSLGSYAVKSTVAGFGGPLTVLVGICDGKVFATKVLSHSETPGLGAKCSDGESHFITQFRGYDFADGRTPSLKKDGGDLDAITASTITSRAYTLAVANAVKLIKENYYGNE